MFKILLSFLIILLSGFFLLNARYAKAGPGDKPLLYSSVVIELLLNVFSFLWFGLFVALFFVNWRWGLAILLTNIVLGNLVSVPLAEYLLYKLHKWILRHGKK